MFVGRAEQLAELEVAWNTPNAIGARIVLLSGEPGIGESRLAAQFAATVHERGTTVLFGRCDEEALRPYQPFAEALSSYLHAFLPTSFSTGWDVWSPSSAGWSPS